MLPEPTGPIAIKELVSCLECGRTWSKPTERWRLYLTDENPPASLAYCPDCAEREFS